MNEKEIIATLENHEERIRNLEGRREKLSLPEKREESLREFIDLYNFKGELDQTLLIIYYLEIKRGLGIITSKEVSSAFSEIRENVPKNIFDKFQKLAKKGYIMSAENSEGSKGWKYTNSGKEYIESLKK